jgi:hypothetical protein
MTRIQKFDSAYGPVNAACVRKSIAKVANAGRTGDPAKIDA